MGDTPASKQSDPLGRRFVSVIIALAIAAVLQFAAVAKVSTGARHLDQLKAARIAESHGLTPKVTAADFQWIIEPGAMPGTIVERGVLTDIAVGTAEFAAVLFVVAFCRRRIVWIFVPIMFGALFGYALERTINNKPCGCFGSLWVPPKGFSLIMDGAFVILGLGLARWHGVKAKALAAVAIITLLGAAGGYIYASRTAAPSAAAPADAATTPSTPPKATPTPKVEPPADTTGPTTEPSDTSTTSLVRDDRPAGLRLLESPMLDDIRDLTVDDAAWYIFIWDPTCPTCEAMLPVIEHYEAIYAEEGNPVLQVRDLMKQDIEKQAGIEPWQWTSSPAVLVIHGGAIIAEYGGEGAPFPDVVSERLFVGESIDDLQKSK